MVLNETGLYLVGANSSVVVFQLNLGVSKFRIAKLEYIGRFSIKNYDSSKWVEEFSGPVDDCRIPYICGKIGVCSATPVPARSHLQRSCPPGFHVNNQTNDGCSPVYDSYSLPSACNASGNDDLKVPTSYMKLGDGMDYSLNDFSEPRVRGVNLSGCEHLCSLNCSCLGLFHDNSSGSCYLLENLLGSIIANSSTDRMGYVKALHVSTSAGPYGKNDIRRNQLFPIAGLVLLPSSVFLLITLVVAGIVCYRKWKSRNSSIELEIDGIPGLPVRFGYKELVAATENFRTKFCLMIIYKRKYQILGFQSCLAVSNLAVLGACGPETCGTGEEEVEKLVRVALCCMHQDPMLRPSMANVVGMLEGGYPVGVPWVESLIFLPVLARGRSSNAPITEGNFRKSEKGSSVSYSFDEGNLCSFEKEGLNHAIEALEVGFEAKCKGPKLDSDSVSHSALSANFSGFLKKLFDR
ncbi:hypothetical protein C3L33_15237, partial [Rhododendron williamsianum]